LNHGDEQNLGGAVHRGAGPWRRAGTRRWFLDMLEKSPTIPEKKIPVLPVIGMSMRSGSRVGVSRMRRSGGGLDRVEHI